MPTKVLIDNSAFAGVMRLYRPDEDMHRTFLRNYQDHRAIDERSLADFITSICIYDKILIESSSGWNEAELRREGYRSDTEINNSTEGWVEQLKRLLPAEISATINTTFCGNESTLSEEQSTKKAFDIMSSPLREQMQLNPDEGIPKVYYAKDYHYREKFEKLNSQAESALSESDLAKAMFLHRGLFLQSYAHSANCIYIPYHSRAKMLSRLPPMTWVAAPEDENINTRLPLASGTRPLETDYMRTLNSFYYTLLQAATWTTYDSNIPFIGAALLSQAKGNIETAFDLALQYRERGALKSRFTEIDEAIHTGDRPKFERLLKAYRIELTEAARSFGVTDSNDPQITFYKLLTCWMPNNMQKAIDAAIELLPEAIRDWGYRVSSTLLSKSASQLLFIEHVSSLRKISIS